MGLDPAALAAWQGHDTKSESSGMSAPYGTNLPEEDILAEQAAKWPNGPVAQLLPLDVHTESGLPTEAVMILEDYMAGKIGDFEFVMEVNKYRKKGSDNERVLDTLRGYVFTEPAEQNRNTHGP